MRSSHWFFTWRTYGTWLPGSDGFVGHYHADDGHRAIDHTFGLPATSAIPALKRYARSQMTGEPVVLTLPHAVAMTAQLHETAHVRQHTIDALAVLVNHVHLVFAAVGEPNPDRCLADWKAYASRALNRLAGEKRDWWAGDGSKRRLLDADARPRAIRYVRDQARPLVVWLSEEAQQLAAGVAGQEPGA